MANISSLINVSLQHQKLRPLPAGWDLMLGTNGHPDPLRVYRRDRGGSRPVKPVASRPTPPMPIYNTTDVVRVSPDGQHVLVSTDGPPYVRMFKWDFANKTYTVLTFPAPASRISDAKFSPDGSKLALSLSNSSPYIAIYDRSGDTYTRLPNPVSPVTGASSSIVDTYRIQTATLSGFWRGYWQGSFGTMVTPPTTYDVSGTYMTIGDGNFMWTTPIEDAYIPLAGHYLEVEDIGIFAIDDASTGIVVEGTMLIWPNSNIFANNTQYQVNLWDGHPDGAPWHPDNINRAGAIEFIDNDRVFLSFSTVNEDFSLGYSFEVFHIDDGEVDALHINITEGTEGLVVDNVLRGNPTGASISPDAEYVVVTSNDAGTSEGGVTAVGSGSYDVQTGNYVDFPAGVENFWCVEFSPDGQLMVLGCSLVDDYQVLVYHNTSSGWTLMGQFPTEGSTDPVSYLPPLPDFPEASPRGIAFSSDGRYLAFALADAPRIVVYRVHYDLVFTRLPDPEVLPTGSALSIAFVMNEPPEEPS
jgi:hypothetical protein